MKFDIFSDALIKAYLYSGITLLLAVFVDYILRSLIKVPKHFENKRARTIAAISRNIITTIVYIFAGYIIITLFGINLTPLLASASVIGVIIGIGARTTIEDFVNGLFLLSLNSMTIGDYIKISDTEGIVELIGARTLTIRSEDGTTHIVPNGQIRELVNFSRHKFNILIDLPVKVNQDIDKISHACDNALKQLLKEPEYAEAIFPGSKINGLEDFNRADSMTIRVTIVTNPLRRFDVARKYRYLVKKEFEKNKLAFA